VAEVNRVRQNISILQLEVRIAYRRAIDSSHHGVQHPASLETREGSGRRRIIIDPTWLRWQYAHDTTSGIARTLGVSRPIVRRALVDYGIAEPGGDPFVRLPAGSSLGQAIASAGDHLSAADTDIEEDGDSEVNTSGQ
jgi:hypothetical protein